MTGHVVHMAVMGLLVSVVAPALVLGFADTDPTPARGSVLAAVALPGFVALHVTVTVAMHGHLEPLVGFAAQVALLLGAVLFWAPVFDGRHRLPDGIRVVYLFAAMPLLDVAGVWLVAVGDHAGGLAMIAGMLPMGLIAVGITWRWITGEERRAQLAETAEATATTAWSASARERST
ncbi:MAG: cytochrome c oxidase assembly protein [Pseudonocardia sp.]|nr:cytochrome c oxidase assembly protein [Pseudonocardia sp.]